MVANKPATAVLTPTEPRPTRPRPRQSPGGRSGPQYSQTPVESSRARSATMIGAVRGCLLKIGVAAFGFACAWGAANNHALLAWSLALTSEGLLVHAAWKIQRDEAVSGASSRIAWGLVALGLVAASLPIWDRHRVDLPVGVDADPVHAHPLYDIGHEH